MLYDHPALYDDLLPVSHGHQQFYGRLARAARGGVLELGCGSGQLTVRLARDCLDIWGLDLSAPMLEVAAARAREAGVLVQLRQGDMRQFELQRQFGLIFIARNSLLHLSTAQDFAGLLAAVRRHLAPGGTLAFDIFVPDVSLLARPAGQRFAVMQVPSARFGELRVEASNDYDPIAQVNRATWFISAANGELWQVPLHLRSIFPQELPWLLTGNGFRLLSRNGDLQGGPFDAQSRLQACVCEPA